MCFYGITFVRLTMPDCFSIDLIKAWVTNCPYQRLGGLCKICVKYCTANRCANSVSTMSINPEPFAWVRELIIIIIIDIYIAQYSLIAQSAVQ